MRATPVIPLLYPCYTPVIPTTKTVIRNLVDEDDD